MNDCGCGGKAKAIGLIDRRSYEWGFDADARMSMVVVDTIDLLAYSRVELWLRVHSAAIAYADGASFALELQAIDHDPEQPDVVFDGGVLTRLVVRDPAAGLLVQRTLPPGVLRSARLHVVMQQADSEELNAVTVSAGLLAVRALGSEAA